MHSNDTRGRGTNARPTRPKALPSTLWATMSHVHAHTQSQDYVSNEALGVVVAQAQAQAHTNTCTP